MLVNVDDLGNYAIRATDGDIGHVKDFFFDDKTWVIRYLVVDTGGWLSSRKVLISPMAVGKPDGEEHCLPVSITREQVKQSPDVDTDMPVSRQHEITNLAYYGFPDYWGGAGLWGAEAYPSLLTGRYAGYVTPPPDVLEKDESIVRQSDAGQQQDEHNLRSCNEVVDYHIEAIDGDIGHVTGMLVDEESWAIRYFIVDTSNWWLGHKVLIAPQWIKDVRWADTTVSVDLTLSVIKSAPAYNHDVPLEREQEILIYQHFGVPAYWAQEVERVDVLSPD